MKMWKADMFNFIKLVFMTKILRFDASKTRKSEFQTLYNSIIRITESFDVEALHISESLKNLKEASPLVEKLNVPALKTPLTEELKEACKKRNSIISSILLQTKGQFKSDDPARVEAAKTLLEVLERFFVYFEKQRHNAQISFAKQFIDEVEANNSLKERLTTLGLDATYSKLKDIHNTVLNAHDKRRKVISVRRKLETTKNKRDLYRLMTNLFVAIEGAALEYPALDYEPLIGELNGEIAFQRFANTFTQSKTEKTDVITSMNTDAQAG
ncbi:hypothetical protein TRIP_D150001 [uncultured Paludibacter sp.]|uniref:Hemagglutinin protein HagB n=1 Tax=uncultured Paludibacter sp. TaxID=497635 RepID=A0A653A617_9BACT|nr:hypothetical protein TRIP_D150001 [uncultured Paludibacter sp.]